MPIIGNSGIELHTGKLNEERARFESEKERWERRFNEVLAEVRAGKKPLGNEG